MENELSKKVKSAIRLLKMADAPLEISYSGGKDSDAILRLAQMAGVEHKAIYKNTTIDPPGTIKHCKEVGAEILKPKMTFFQLIEKKGFPTRRARFCCEVLKEYKVMDNAVQGIRRSESNARAERYKEPIICRNYSKKEHVNVFLPILNWTDEDVREFIISENISLHPLYYDDWGRLDVSRRLGCIGCPMKSDNGLSDFKKYPNMVKAWCKAGQKWIDTHPNANSQKNFSNVYELFTHNVFFHSFEDFDLVRRGGLWNEKIDFKDFLENYFKIDL